jgi:hypothetical protein
MRPKMPNVPNALRFRRHPPSTNGGPPAPNKPAGGLGGPQSPEKLVDLARRRDELMARVAELQWDLGGLAYEMAIRDRIRIDVLVRRAAALQELDAELGEVERILRMEETGSAGVCASCGAPHSSGAVYCWQCGSPLLEQVPHTAIKPPSSDDQPNRPVT